MRGAQRRQRRHDGQGLHALLAQAAQAQGAQPLGELAAGGVGDQRQMGELRRRVVQGGEHRQLQGGVADMVLATNDVGDAQLGIVDGRREQVGGAAVLADDHGVAQRAGGEAARAHDQVVEGELAFGQVEAPVGLAAALGLSLAHRAPSVARRQALRPLPIAQGRQLFGRLVARIGEPGLAQSGEGDLVAIGPPALAQDGVPAEPEPTEILLDRLVEHRLRPLAVGVVDAQDELAALVAREQPVDHRDAGIAQVQIAGRAGREPDDGLDHAA